MFDSPIIDVAIGLFFLFAILSTIAAAIAEFISRRLGLRGTYLLKGLRTGASSGSFRPTFPAGPSWPRSCAM
jgi:hypothetical protein